MQECPPFIDLIRARKVPIIQISKETNNQQRHESPKHVHRRIGPIHPWQHR
jgi:hypothetical protein